MIRTLPNSEAGVSRALDLLRTANTRLVSIFGSTDDNHVRHVHYLIDVSGREYRMLSSPVTGPIPSATPATPSAAWYERELHDQYGIECVGHPDPRPLLFHENWPENVHPMIDNASHVPWTSTEGRYRFLKVQGDGVCEVPVGPIHAGIIEPGHFRFTAGGETVARLEQRLGYVHKGIESLMTGATIEQAARLAARTSGDSTVAYGIAFAQAVEAALAIEAPPRAKYLRALMAELERLANHFGDIGAICNDASFALMHAHCSILREQVLRAADACFGHRLMMDRVVPGGVADDIHRNGPTLVRDTLQHIRARFPRLVELYDNTASLQDRTVATGVVAAELARQFGAAGYVGRASSAVTTPVATVRSCSEAVLS